MAVPVLLFVFVFFLFSLALLWRPSWLPHPTSTSRGGAIHSCIGYLDHPFEKEDPWAFTARIFLVVKWGYSDSRWWIIRTFLPLA